MRRDLTLYRDTDEGVIGGVCAGLAHYFDVDTLLVRVAFVAAMVFGGAPLVAYALLWWLVNPAPEGHWSAERDGSGDTAPPADTPFDPPASRAA